MGHELTEPNARRPYSYEGHRQWDIDVANIGIAAVRTREQQSERALVEHEALGPFGIRDLIEIGDLDHPDGCHGCWALREAERHPDGQHELSCALRPCGDVDSHLLIAPDIKASLIVAGMTRGMSVGLPLGIAIGVLLTLLAVILM